MNMFCWVLERGTDATHYELMDVFGGRRVCFDAFLAECEQYKYRPNTIQRMELMQHMLRRGVAEFNQACLPRLRMRRIMVTQGVK